MENTTTTYFPRNILFTYFMYIDDHTTAYLVMNDYINSNTEIEQRYYLMAITEKHAESMKYFLKFLEHTKSNTNLLNLLFLYSGEITAQIINHIKKEDIQYIITKEYTNELQIIDHVKKILGQFLTRDVVQYIISGYIDITKTMKNKYGKYF
jgi:hypothetical protein